MHALQMTSALSQDPANTQVSEENQMLEVLLKTSGNPPLYSLGIRFESV